jgi:hypothetical protein
MIIARRNIRITALSLAADTTLAATRSVVMQDGHLSIHVSIDNGAGIAPTDTPVGVWELYTSGDGINFYRLTNAAIVAELALIAPNGNNLVNAWAVFSNVPGTAAKLLYNQTSGGGTSAVATIDITT